MMAGKIRRATVLLLFPALTLAAFLWRPDFLDAVALRQMAIVCGGYAAVLAVCAVFTMRPNSEVRDMARAIRESREEFVRERADLQTRLDFLAAQREIGLVLKDDVDFETILGKVLTITSHALGGQPDDEIEIYLREGSKLCLRAALREGKAIFARRGRPPEGSLAEECVEHARLMFCSQNGHLEVVAPLASDGEIGGVVRVRTRVGGKRTEQLTEHLEEFSRFISLAVKTPNLYTRAVEDGLTGLATKRHFLNLLDQQMSSSRRYGDPLSLIMVDIDHFKKVNDNHGHLAGDRVLKGVAAILRRNVRRGSDQAGFRYGGEELGLLLPKATVDRAAGVAERLRESVEARQFSGGLRVTVSIGVAQMEEGMAPEALIQKADEALYRAKEGGRNRVVVANGVPA